MDEVPDVRGSLGTQHVTPVADPEFHNGDGGSRGGVCAPSPEKK